MPAISLVSTIRMTLARPLTFSACLALSACAVVSTADGERLPLASAAFRGYIERVFREQNGVADELAFALEAPGARRIELAAAEEELLEACASVNELAAARRDQRRLGVRNGVRAARTVPNCERATRAAEAKLAASE